MNAAYLIAGALWSLIIVRFISGVAMGVIGTATGTFVATIVPRNLHGRGIAYYSMSTALALCYRYCFVGNDWLHGNFHDCHDAFVDLMCFVIDATPKLDRTKPQKSITLDDFIDRRLVPFSIWVGIVCICWGNVQALLAGYAQEYDVVAAASLFFLFYAVATLVTRPISGRLYDAHGPAVLIYPCLVLMVIGLVLLALHLGSVAVLVAGVLMGTGFGNFQSISQASGISLVPRERFAQATSTTFIFFDLGFGIAPYLSGYLVEPMGYAGIFGLNAALVALTIPLYWYVWTYRRAKPVATSEELPLDKHQE